MGNIFDNPRANAELQKLQSEGKIDEFFDRVYDIVMNNRQDLIADGYERKLERFDQMIRHYIARDTEDGYKKCAELEKLKAEIAEETATPQLPTVSL